MKKLTIVLISILAVINSFSQYILNSDDIYISKMIEYKKNRYLFLGYHCKDNRNNLFKTDEKLNILDLNTDDRFKRIRLMEMIDSNRILLETNIEDTMKLFIIDTNYNILKTKIFVDRKQYPVGYYLDSNYIYIAQNNYVEYQWGRLDSLRIYKFNYDLDTIASHNYPPPVVFDHWITYLSGQLSLLPNNKLLFVASGLNDPVFYSIDTNLNFLGFSTFNIDPYIMLYQMATFRVWSKNEILFSLQNSVYCPDTFYHALVITDTNFNVTKIKKFTYNKFPINTENVFQSLDFVDRNNIYTLSFPNLITNLDSNLEIRWQKYYDSPYTLLDFNLYIFATQDGGAIIFSEYSNDFFRRYEHVIKVDSLGHFPLDLYEKTKIEFSDFWVYPNPTSGIINIQKGPQIKNAIIQIYNTSGKIVATNEFSKDVNQLDLSFLSNGTYFYTITNNNEIIDKGKIVIQK